MPKHGQGQDGAFGRGNIRLQRMENARILRSTLNRRFPLETSGKACVGSDDKGSRFEGATVGRSGSENSTPLMESSGMLGIMFLESLLGGGEMTGAAGGEEGFGGVAAGGEGFAAALRPGVTEE